MLELNKVHLGNNLDLIKQIPNNTVDSIVTDPPYGISFMNKKWDYDVPSVEFWKEAYRVLKPGGHILVACGTRTQHRMAVNIEDAGFEIRDIVAWIYGSGFPKSTNVTIQIDKKLGVMGHRGKAHQGFVVGTRRAEDGKELEKSKQMETHKGISDEAKQWQGFGTALKPSAEYFTLAKKPMHDKETSNEIMEVSKCLLKSFVRIVESTSSLNPKDSKGVSNIAQWIAKENTDTLEDLLEVMGMLQSYITENTNSNIVLLWLNTLVDLWKIKNTSTIKMELNTTTELKILKSMEWENILQNIILPKENQNVGQSAFVYDVASIFNVLKLKSMHIITHIAQENASSVQLDPKTNIELFTLARKPIEGTVANNVLKYGTGAINIDGCRVETNDFQGKTFTKPNLNQKSGTQGIYNGTKIGAERLEYEQSELGRFPANVIHDGSDEVVAMFPDTNPSKATYRGLQNSGRHGGYGDIGSNLKDGTNTIRGIDDNGGSAARFFYTSKASQSERNEGLYGFEDTQTTDGCIRTNAETARKYGANSALRKNFHPTVKPLDLMQYLCRLITPRGGLVLEPFAGSGTTCIAAKLERMNYIGMEIDAEYVKICEARIKAADVQYDIFDFLGE